MATSKLDRLLFAQGGLCFFCRDPLPRASASIEHLVASANGGKNDDDNCVACCTALNRLLGSMSLKEKVQVVLNQKGNFKCPDKAVSARKAPSKTKSAATEKKTSRMKVALQDLQKRDTSRPRSLKTLKSTLDALFKKELSDEQLGILIDELQETGHVRITGQVVSYEFPTK